MGFVFGVIFATFAFFAFSYFRRSQIFTRSKKREYAEFLRDFLFVQAHLGEFSAIRPTNRAIDFLISEADRGKATAQSELAWLYDSGRAMPDVPQDVQRAIDLYMKAAEQGEPVAQYNLGMMYSKGRGVPQNKQQALKWLWLSSRGGNAQADVEGLAIAKNMCRSDLIRVQYLVDSKKWIKDIFVILGWLLVLIALGFVKALLHK